MSGCRLGAPARHPAERGGRRGPARRGGPAVPGAGRRLFTCGERPGQRPRAPSGRRSAAPRIPGPAEAGAGPAGTLTGARRAGEAGEVSPARRGGSAWKVCFRRGAACSRASWVTLRTVCGEAALGLHLGRVPVPASARRRSGMCEFLPGAPDARAPPNSWLGWSPMHSRALLSRPRGAACGCFACLGAPLRHRSDGMPRGGQA